MHQSRKINFSDEQSRFTSPSLRVAYLFPRLFPAGGFFSWRSCPPVPKPADAGLDTPNVRPADAVMPGLLKLNPDVVELPKPYEGGKNILKRKLYEDCKFVLLGVMNTNHFITNTSNTLYWHRPTTVCHIADAFGLAMATFILQP